MSSLKISSILKDTSFINNVDPPEIGETILLAGRNLFYTDAEGHEFMSLERTNNQLSKSLYSELYTKLSDVGIYPNLEPIAGIEYLTDNDPIDLTWTVDRDVLNQYDPVTSCVGNDGTVYIPEVNSVGTVLNIARIINGGPKQNIYTGYDTNNLREYLNSSFKPVASSVKGKWVFVLMEDTADMVMVDLDAVATNDTANVFSLHSFNVGSQDVIASTLQITGSFHNFDDDVIYLSLQANSSSVSANYTPSAFIYRIDISSGTPVITEINNSETDAHHITHIQVVDNKVYGVGYFNGYFDSPPPVSSPSPSIVAETASVRVFEYTGGLWEDLTGEISVTESIRYRSGINSFSITISGQITGFTYVSGELWISYADRNFGAGYHVPSGQSDTYYSPGASAAPCKVLNIVSMSDWSHVDYSITAQVHRAYLTQSGTMGSSNTYTWIGGVRIDIGSFDGLYLELDIDLDYAVGGTSSIVRTYFDHIARIDGLEDSHSVRYFTPSDAKAFLSALQANVGSYSNIYPNAQTFINNGNLYTEIPGTFKSNVFVESWLGRKAHMVRAQISEVSEIDAVGLRLTLTSSDSTLFNLPTIPRVPESDTDHLYMRIR